MSKTYADSAVSALGLEQALACKTGCPLLARSLWARFRQPRQQSFFGQAIGIPHSNRLYVDQPMPIALSAGQNILELLNERLSPLRIGPSQQLLGFLPRQLEAVQGRPDRLAAAHQPEALAGPADQAAQGPARRRIRPD
jgi:hypothetical protein